MNRLFVKWRALIGGAVLLLVIPLLWVGRAQKTGKAQTVFGEVKRQDLIQRVTIAGYVVSQRKTVIAAPYNGYIRKLFVKPGDKVSLGDPIVLITQSLQNADAAFPLRAPFSGTVVHVEKSEGEYVRENEPKDFIARIDDLSRLYVIANTPEIDRLKIQVGQKTVLKASAVLEKSYDGVVREMSLAAKEREQWGKSQVEFPVRIEVLELDSQLKPGMTVVVDIVTAKKAAILALRHEYIQVEEKKYFVVMKDGSRRDVTVGLQNEEAFEIISGLVEGEKVKQVDFSQIGAE